MACTSVVLGYIATGIAGMGVAFVFLCIGFAAGAVMTKRVQ